MSDILEYAKKLTAERRNIAPADLHHATVVSDKMSLFAGAAFAALAEESYQYGAEYLHNDNWVHIENSETHMEVWWDDKTDAEDDVEEFRQQGHTARLVRRRTSPPEVME